jgi:hypothetical protein
VASEPTFRMEGRARDRPVRLNVELDHGEMPGTFPSEVRG